MATSELDPPKKGRAISLTVVRTELRNPAKKQTVADSGSAAGSKAEPAGPRNNFYTIRIPAEPTTFSFAKQSAASGLKFLTFSTLFFGTAAFLLFEMHHTPLLRLPIITVAVICIAIGLVLGHLSIRTLLGRVRVDAQGIRLTPRYLGYFISWSELRGWNVDGLTFRFRAQRVKHDLTIDCDHLTDDDRRTLHELLLSCATEKEFETPVKKAR